MSFNMNGWENSNFILKVHNNPYTFLNHRYLYNLPRNQVNDLSQLMASVCTLWCLAQHSTPSRIIYHHVKEIRPLEKSEKQGIGTRPGQARLQGIRIKFFKKIAPSSLKRLLELMVVHKQKRGDLCFEWKNFMIFGTYLLQT